ncbi:TRAP transporter small permease subunit [Chloroflexota bacterium]
MRKLTAFLRIIDRISEWSGKIISFLIVLMIGTFIWSILHRYVFHLGTTWNIMVAIRVFAVYIVMGSAYALYSKAHVNVSILYDRFPQRVRSILDLFTFIFFFIFCMALLWVAIEKAGQDMVYHPLSLKSFLPSNWPVMVVAPVGILFFLLQGLAKFIRDLIIVITGKEPT